MPVTTGSGRDAAETANWGRNQSMEQEALSSPAAIDEDETVGTDFAPRLLHALAVMARRSRRAEADLMAALQAAGLPADPVPVRAALLLLQKNGCIRDLVPLWDGGLLLTVTGLAMGQLDQTSPWLPLDGLALPELDIATVPRD